MVEEIGRDCSHLSGSMLMQYSSFRSPTSHYRRAEEF